MGAQPPAPLYELQITGIGPLVSEFTDAGVWVFFREGAPDELAEFALLHTAAPPSAPIAVGQVLEIDGQRFAITAVGAVANDNLRNLGHIVLKASGATEPEMPGDVCIAALPLPTPTIGMMVRVWPPTEEDGDGALRTTA